MSTKKMSKVGKILGTNFGVSFSFFLISCDNYNRIGCVILQISVFPLFRASSFLIDLIVNSKRKCIKLGVVGYSMDKVTFSQSFVHRCGVGRLGESYKNDNSWDNRTIPIPQSSGWDNCICVIISLV